MIKQKIFISYRREDTAGSAGRMYDSLSNHFGNDVLFKDIDNIQIGQNFLAVIEKSIKDCKIVLVVIGRQFTSVKNKKGQVKIFQPEDYVNIEINLSLAFNKVVIPILVDGAKMPDEEEFPADLSALVMLNAFSLRHERWRTDITSLTRRLEQILKEGLDNEEKLKKAHSFSPKNLSNYTNSLPKQIKEETRDKNYDRNILDVQQSESNSKVPDGQSAKEGRGENDNSKVNKAIFLSSFGEIRSSLDKVLRDPDGNEYPILRMNDNRLWLGRNLNLKVSNSSFYENDSRNENRYGRLYTWEAAISAGRKFAKGWRLPTEAEWQNLTNYYEGIFRDSANAGELAYKSLLVGGESRFDALLGGYQDANDNYYLKEINGGYWTGTETDLDHSWCYFFKKIDSGRGGNLYKNKSSKTHLFSCRLIYDENT